MVDDYQPTEDVSPNAPPVADDRGTIQTYFAGDASMTRLREALEQQGSEPEDTVAVRIDHVETESATAGPISTETIDGRVDSPVLRTDVNDGITLFVPVINLDRPPTTESLYIRLNSAEHTVELRVPELLTVTITEDGVPAHLDVETPVDFDIKFSFLEKEDITIPEYHEELEKAFAEMPGYDADESATSEDSEESNESSESSESSEFNE